MTIETIGGRAGADYTGQTDAYMHPDFPDTNNSADAESQGYPFLINFPGLSNIPSGATINDAYITFNVTSGKGSTDTISIARILRAAVLAQITHNEWATSSSWTTAGALSEGNDVVAADSATFPYNSAWATGDIDTTSNTTLIADIQDIVDGTLATTTWWRFYNSGFAVGFVSNTTAANRPLLTVDYTEGGGSFLTRNLWWDNY